MPLSEIRPGQIGVVHTVFQGTKVEQFECEVLGIMKDAIGLHKDLILVRLRGQKPEFTGVVAGMSGSPVYIDDKLIGALAYRFGIFTKEPIAGVTPIEYMFEADSYNGSAGHRSALTPGWDFDLSGGGVAASLSSQATAGVNQPIGDIASVPTMVPIDTPLVFSGFDRRLVDRFADVFRKNNFVPMMGGGGSGDEHQDSEFEPGAAISCVLMRGDMSIAGTGTLTYRDGDKVMGFGHPMFQSGPAQIPMAKADIALTLSSTYASTKIGRPTEIVGAITQDRLTAITGRVGVTARMIPVSVDVNTAGSQSRSYHFEMFEEPFYTPLLLNFALANSMLSSMDNSNVQTIKFNGKIEIDGHPSVNIADVVSSDDMELISPSALRMSSEIARVFAEVYGNGIERPIISRITLRIDQTAERSGAVIEEVRSDRDEVKPGEEFNIAVILRPYRSDTVTKIIKVRLPETAERGRELRIMASDGSGLEAAEGDQSRMVAMRLPGGSPTAGPATLDELIARLNRGHPSNAIYVRVSQAVPGAFINQQSLPALPLSMLSVIGSSQTAANTIRTADSALTVNTESVAYAVRGSKVLRIMVR
jgi:hypothetical protein